MIIKDPNLNIISLWIWFYIYKKANKKFTFFYPVSFFLIWNEITHFAAKVGIASSTMKQVIIARNWHFIYLLVVKNNLLWQCRPKSLLQKLDRLLLHTWQHLCLLSDHTFIRLVVVDFLSKTGPYVSTHPLSNQTPRVRILVVIIYSHSTSASTHTNYYWPLSLSFWENFSFLGSLQWRRFQLFILREFEKSRKLKVLQFPLEAEEQVLNFLTFGQLCFIQIHFVFLGLF